MTPDTAPRANWTRLNRILHWAILVLLVAQYFLSESMQALWDATTEGAALTPADRILGWGHIIVGSLLLVAGAVRLVDRYWNGRPDHPASESAALPLLAKATHGLIYALLLAMPLAGLAAWFTGNDALAGIHTLLWTPLLVLIAVHVAGALVQHFHFRNDTLTRMASLRK